MDSPDCYCYFWVYLFSTFSFSVFTLLAVGSVRWIKLTHVGFRAHVKIASRIVSYRYLSGARCRLARGPADTPLPFTVSCFSKIHIGFTYLVPAHPGSPEQRAVKRVCVCVCVCVCDWLNGFPGLFLLILLSIFVFAFQFFFFPTF